MKIHIVQQGDTLWKLAKKYDVDFEQLKVVNNHLSNPDVIMPGMKIKIPTGGVPVKKKMVKKEEPIQVKEEPKVKEVPKKELQVPSPIKPKPPVMQPIEIQPIQQQPMLTQQQYEQHLHNMNMNFNIYKPAPVAPNQIPAPPKMPEMKEAPKMAKPKPMVPPTKEFPKAPKIDEMPQATPMLPTMPQCYPVTGIVPCNPYQVPAPVCSPYQQSVPQYPPMAPQMPAYGYSQGSFAPAPTGYTPVGYSGQQPVYQQPIMPNYPQTGFGMPQPPTPQYGMPLKENQWVSGGNKSVDMEEEYDNDYSKGMPSMVPNANMQMPPNSLGNPNLYGDLTMPQPMPPQQWGYQQPMMRQQPPSSPHPAQRYIQEENED